MENTRENTPFRKLLRLVPPKLRNWLHPEFEETNKKSSSTQANVSQTRKGPANSTWPAHQGSGLALTLKSERKMAIYCTPCPLRYGGCRSLARKKGELWLLRLLQTRQMASCFWFRSLPWARARNMLIFSMFAYATSPPHPLPPPLEHVLTASRP